MIPGLKKIKLTLFPVEELLGNIKQSSENLLELLREFKLIFSNFN